MRGLQVVDDKQVLHRNIKLARLTMRASGEPVSLDFGAAREALAQRGSDATVMLTPRRANAGFMRSRCSASQPPRARARGEIRTIRWR
jgi:hypothetical protein